MNPYHKIQTVYLRNPDNKFKTLLEGRFANPEFEYLQNNLWRFDEKVDGTCNRIILENEHLVIKGKQENSQIQPELLVKLEDIFQPRLKEMNKVFKKYDAYKALVKITELPRLVEMISYDMFLNKFNSYNCTDEEYNNWKLLLLYGKDLKKGYVNFK